MEVDRALIDVALATDNSHPAGLLEVTGWEFTTGKETLLCS